MKGMSGLKFWGLLVVGLTACAPANADQALGIGSPWTDLEGCYDTVERNGQVVPKPDYMNKTTTFKSGSSHMMRDLDGKEIPSLELIIFQKYSKPENTLYMDWQPVFETMGQYAVAADGTRHFGFNGKLIYDATEFGGGKSFFHLEIALSIKSLGNDEWFFTQHRRVPEVPDHSMDVDDTYLLKKIICPKDRTDEISVSGFSAQLKEAL